MSPINVPRLLLSLLQTWVKDISWRMIVHPRVWLPQFRMRISVKLGNLKGAMPCCAGLPSLSFLSAMTCIRNKIACKIEGRDIAAKITKTLKRWKVKSLDSSKPNSKSISSAKGLNSSPRNKRIGSPNWRIWSETQKAIIDHCRQKQYAHGLEQVAVAYTESLLADGVDNILTLSTIHKSKGREWRRVFWLDRAGTCPSRWARQAWQQQQERNLQYVAATCAMQRIVRPHRTPKED